MSVFIVVRHDFGLSTRAGISRQEASRFIDDYFATYSGISYYMLHIKEVARDQGYVTTLLGRRRFIPELNSPVTRAMGERMAINMPIQGTAADIVKIAMIRLDERLRAGGFRARLLLQVHDELLLEVPRDEVARQAVAPHTTGEEQDDGRDFAAEEDQAEVRRTADAEHGECERDVRHRSHYAKARDAIPTRPRRDQEAIRIAVRSERIDG